MFDMVWSKNGAHAVPYLFAGGIDCLLILIPDAIARKPFIEIPQMYNFSGCMCHAAMYFGTFCASSFCPCHPSGRI